MPNYKAAFPSKYLSAADLDDATPTVTIKTVTTETVGDDSKLVVYFVGKDKGVVLNKTNANSIAELAMSDDTDDWPGTKVMLIVVKVEFQGKRVPAIRMEAPPRAKGAKAAKVVQEPDPDVTDVTDSDVPF
jgi:hypothetical protein